MKRITALFALTIAILAAAIPAHATKMLKITLSSGDVYTIKLNREVNVTFPDQEHTSFEQAGNIQTFDTAVISKVEHIEEQVTGVASPTVDAAISLDGSTLRLTGISEAKLYSADGKYLAIATADGAIDISQFPRGVYLLATPLGTYKFTY